MPRHPSAACVGRYLTRRFKRQNNTPDPTADATLALFTTARQLYAQQLELQQLLARHAQAISNIDQQLQGLQSPRVQSREVDTAARGNGARLPRPAPGQAPQTGPAPGSSPGAPKYPAYSGGGQTGPPINYNGPLAGNYHGVSPARPLSNYVDPSES
jgi:hypothetical protein